MQGKEIAVHGVTLAVCVVALVFTPTFFLDRPLLPEAVFIAILAAAVGMIIVSMTVWLKSCMEESLSGMEERILDSCAARNSARNPQR